VDFSLWLKYYFTILGPFLYMDNISDWSNSVDALVKNYLEQSGYTVLEHPHGYNEAVPQERANERKQELAGVIARSPFQPDIPTPAPVEIPELEIPVYTRKKKTEPTPALAL
jgi:hypothetical protein